MNQLSEIQQKIQIALEEFKALKVVESHVNEINEQLKSAYQNLKAMDKGLDKELKDIDAIEKIGVRSLFLKTLGNKEQQLEKERQEYLELSLKYKELKKSVELMEFERDVLNKKINQLPAYKSKIEVLKKEREKEILIKGDATTQNEFKEILHQMDVNILLRKEISEALKEGKRALEHLKSIGNFLRKIASWGNYGHYQSKRAIDKALASLVKAQHQLNLFSRELKDLGENNISFRLNRTNFNNVSNFFFDNLITDWIVQQRIKNTIDSIDGTYDHVHRILLSLVQEEKKVKQTLDRLNTEKDNYLLS